MWHEFGSFLWQFGWLFAIWLAAMKTPFRRTILMLVLQWYLVDGWLIQLPWAIFTAYAFTTDIIFYLERKDDQAGKGNAKEDGDEDEEEGNGQILALPRGWQPQVKTIIGNPIARTATNGIPDEAPAVAIDREEQGPLSDLDEIERGRS